ncbi:hypothetical protein L2230_12080, partial [Xanthomonas perforans]|uniref:hypothetical protein n=1 Tax=Xanthomonas perforans TaxID=442694 RepID=UPI001F1AD9B9
LALAFSRAANAAWQLQQNTGGQYMDCFEKSYGQRPADRGLVERDDRHALAHGAMPPMPPVARG